MIRPYRDRLLHTSWPSELVAAGYSGTRSYVTHDVARATRS